MSEIKFDPEWPSLDEINWGDQKSTTAEEFIENHPEAWQKLLVQIRFSLNPQYPDAWWENYCQCILKIQYQDRPDRTDVMRYVDVVGEVLSTYDKKKKQKKQ